MDTLTQHLEAMLADLEALIQLTEEDIAAVKAGQHALVDRNNAQKTVLIRRFETSKNRLNTILSERTAAAGEATLHEVLSEEEKVLLERFKKALEELRRCNRTYARFVVTMNEFFGGLVSAILPMKEEGYTVSRPKPAAFLQVSA